MSLTKLDPTPCERKQSHWGSLRAGGEVAVVAGHDALEVVVVAHQPVHAAVLAGQALHLREEGGCCCYCSASRYLSACARHVLSLQAQQHCILVYKGV